MLTLVTGAGTENYIRHAWSEGFRVYRCMGHHVVEGGTSPMLNGEEVAVFTWTGPHPGNEMLWEPKGDYAFRADADNQVESIGYVYEGDEGAVIAAKFHDGNWGSDEFYWDTDCKAWIMSGCVNIDN